MVTRNISLTPQQSAFIDEVVESGEFQNASEAMRAAIRVMQERREMRALKLEKLRAELQLGIDDLEAGRYVELDATELRAYLQGLVAKRKKPRKR
jgi:antitoxin ParD1/3/4